MHGVSRDAAHQPFARLHALRIRERVTTHTSSTTDRAALQQLITHVRPNEIYNLAGLSSVAESFVDASTATTSIAGAQQTLLDVVRDCDGDVRVYHSASSDCFGDLPHGTAADERTPFAPRSPYAAAKADAHRITAEYREHFGLFAVSAIVCNHESPLRGAEFVTAKIVAAAAAAARGELTGKLQLGDVSVARDWGYAPEYVEAMWRMLQQDRPADYVLATGESHTVDEFAQATFAAFGLDHRELVASDPSLLRTSDIRYSRGNPALAQQQLQWSARSGFRDLVEILADAAKCGMNCGNRPRH